MPRTHRDPSILVSIPLLIALVPVLLLYVLPSSVAVDKILTELLHNTKAEWVLKLSLLVLISASPFYVYQRATRPLSGKKQQELLDLIRVNVNSKYNLRMHVRDSNLDSVFSKSTHFLMASRFFDFYKSELNIFADIVADSILKLPNDNSRPTADSMVLLVNELISNKAREFVPLLSENLDRFHRLHFLTDSAAACLKNDFHDEITKEAES